MAKENNIVRQPTGWAIIFATLIVLFLCLGLPLVFVYLLFGWF